MTGPPAPPNSVSHGGAFFYEADKTVPFLWWANWPSACSRL